MHVVRRKRRTGHSGEAFYLYLRETFRPNGGEVRERSVYLGPEKAEDLDDRVRKVLRRCGYTPAQTQAILEAVRARVERNEHVSISVRGKPVQWREAKR